MLRNVRLRGLSRRGWWYLVACLTAVVAIGGWAGESLAGQAASCPDSVRVGLIFPQTGREGRPGTYQLEGIRLAIEQINAKGGVDVKACGKRLPIKEVAYDDQSDQGRSVQLAERTMSSDNVVAVLGGYSTVLGEAQSVVADRYQVPWITPGAAASAIFSQGRQWVFGTLTPVDVLGYTTMKFLGSLVDQGKLDKGLKLAIAVENTDHGKDYVDGVAHWIKDHPGYFTIAFNESFQLGGTDFSGLLQRVKAANGDIFLSDAHLQDYITMHRQYTQLGLYHQMVSYGARGPEEPARKALGRAADFIFAGTWWEKGLPYPQVKAFAQAYKKKYNHDPDNFYPATAYEGMRMLAAAIEAAGSLDRTAVRDALRKVRLTDSLVPGQVLEFQKNGQASAPFVIVQNKPEGRVDFVYPEDTKTGEVVTKIPR
ncbi:MAG TPA: amino acid ABC transporter substrate-binding protein [Candidatus Methylomirabilis sp.]|nr:amino acid ABC transporter substrate-binding protein [Candidatus Methylomirabilis sp.]